MYSKIIFYGKVIASKAAELRIPALLLFSLPPATRLTPNFDANYYRRTRLRVRMDMPPGGPNPEQQEQNFIMALRDKLEDDIKESMRNRDQARLDALRFMKFAVQAVEKEQKKEHQADMLDRMLAACTQLSAAGRHGQIVGVGAVVAVVALLGMSKLEVYHNPLVWMGEDHPTTVGVLTMDREVGGISAVLDNIPVMFAVLGMDPNMGDTEEMRKFQWLLITLTAGVGGSMLSVGSAAGVARTVIRLCTTRG